MSVLVNDVEITDAQVEAEIAYHDQAPRPVDAALRALVIRQVVLDEARRLGFDTQDPDQAATDLIAQEVVCPVATDIDCLRHYHAHPAHFTVGELAEVSHILFQVTPNLDLAGLRAKAQSVLEQIKTHPDQFAQLAREYSNCPSAEVGGNLGQLARGDTVSQFDRAIFATPSGTLLNHLLETQFGLHIIRVERRVEGKVLPYEQVKHQIGKALHAASQDRATQQYLKVLLARANIQGIDLEAADGVLVQ